MLKAEQMQALPHPKKVGTILGNGNEIKTTIPLLDVIDIEGKTITADALFTQRDLAKYLIEDRNAHYHFTVKGNQPNLLRDIKLFFQDRQEPDFVQCDPPDHGRIEIRKIWTTTELNDYLDFPYVGQVFLIERQFIEKKTDKESCEFSLWHHQPTPGAGRSSAHSGHQPLSLVHRKQLPLYP